MCNISRKRNYDWFRNQPEGHEVGKRVNINENATEWKAKVFIEEICH